VYQVSWDCCFVPTKGWAVGFREVLIFKHKLFFVLTVLRGCNTAHAMFGRKLHMYNTIRHAKRYPLWVNVPRFDCELMRCESGIYYCPKCHCVHASAHRKEMRFSQQWCSPLKFHRRFRGTYRLNLEGRRISKLLSRWFHLRLLLRHWILRRYVPPKRHLTFNGPHGDISQRRNSSLTPNL
jgi:hypothetical protein